MTLFRLLKKCLKSNIVFAVLLISFAGHAQDIRKIDSIIDVSTKKRDLNKVFRILRDSTSKYPKNPHLNFKLGEFLVLKNYWDLSFRYLHLTRLLKYKKDYTNYLLVLANLGMNRYKSADKAFKNINVDNIDKDSTYIDILSDWIECGLKGMEKTDTSVKVENFGNKVNTTFSEYTPAIDKTDNNKLLYFTRSKTEFDEKYFGNLYRLNYKDFSIRCVDGKDKNQYLHHSLLKVGPNFRIENQMLKTKSRYVSIGLNTFDYYRFNKNDIIIYRKVREKWKYPKGIDLFFSGTGMDEMILFDLSMTNDKRVAVFSVLDEKNGVSNLYYTVLQENTYYSFPKKLNVSSSYDEIDPFFAENGDLYFSSNRQNSYGMFDVYKVKILDWSNPSEYTLEHLPMPINSGGNEFNFKKYGGVYYFSSDRAGGYGGLDIYKIENSDL